MDELRRLTDKLLGHGRFLMNAGSKKSQHIVLIRAQKAGSFDLALPQGVKGYLGANNIPGALYASFGGFKHPLFAKGSAAYAGEPVAMTVGSSAAEAAALASQAVISYKDDAPRIDLEHFEESDVLYRRSFSHGDVGAAFSFAAETVSETYATPAQDAMMPCRQGAHAVREGNAVLVYAATQQPHLLASQVAALLNIETSHVEARSCALGKTMENAIIPPVLAGCYAALAAWQTKKPTRLIYGAKEEFLYLPKRPPVLIHLHAALDVQGEMIGFDADVRINAGAYGCMIDEISDRMAYAAAGFYRKGAYRINVRAVGLPLPPAGPYPAFGLASMQFALECFLTKLAERRNRSPIEGRKFYLLQKGDAHTGGVILKKEPPFEALIDKAAKISDFKRKYAAYQLTANLRKANKEKPDFFTEPWRGIGLGIGFIGSGFMRPAYNGAKVRVELNDDQNAIIYTSAMPENTALYKEWRRIAATQLNISEEKAHVVCESTALTPDSGYSAAGQPLTVITPLIESCCMEIRKKRFHQGLPIIAERSHRRNTLWKAEAFEGQPFQNISYAACVAEVEINPASFNAHIRSLHFCLDCGRILNPYLAKSEIEADILQTIGWLSREKTAFVGGVIPEFYFEDYRIPSVYSEPAFTYSFVPEGRSKARSLGGLIQCCLPAAYACAAGQAISKEISSFPIAPRGLFELDFKNDSEKLKAW